MALLILVLALAAAGCGGDDEDEGTATSNASATSQQSTTTGQVTTTTGSITTSQPPTSQPATTAEASTDPQITVDFVCGNGQSGTVDVPTDDIEQIDQIVNTIDLCEFLGGLAQISFVAPCPSGDREVVVAAADGEVPDIATLDLCEDG